MAESHASRATRAAYEVIEARLLALRSRTEEGAGGYVVKELERLVNCICQLRGAPQKQPGNTPEVAPKQPDASLGSGSVGGTIGGAQKPPRLKKKEYQRINYTEDFEAFWKIYPKIRRKQKPKCFEVWGQLPIEIRRAAYANVRDRSAGDRQWLDGYAPLTLTYLRNDGWDDAWESTRPGAGETLEERARAMAAKYDEPYESMLESLQRQEAANGRVQ